MDFLIINNPVRGTDFRIMREMENASDKMRMKYFRRVLSDMSDVRDEREKKGFLAGALTATGMGFGEGWGAWGGLAHGAVMGTIEWDLVALKRLKHHFHKQTGFRYATTGEKYFNPSTAIWWALATSGVIFLLVAVAVLLCAKV